MSEVQGKVSQVLGAVVDVVFPHGQLPEIYDAVRIPRAGDDDLPARELPIRAEMLSTLTLFMPRIDADYAYNPFTLNHLALVAYPFYRCADFHQSSPQFELFRPINNPPPGQVIGR